MSRDEWLMWREHPTAIVWERLIAKELEDHFKDIYDSNSVDRTAMRTAHFKGFVDAAELLQGLEPDFEDEE